MKMLQLSILLVTGFVFLNSNYLCAQSEDADEEETGNALEKEKEKARKHFIEGAALFDKKDYGVALEKFELAFDTYPHWSSRFNIGMCHYYLGNHIRAIVELLAFMDEVKMEAPVKMLMEAKKIIKSTRSEIASITITGIEEDAEIKVDGAAPETSPGGEEIFLMPGLHTIKVISKGIVLMDEKLSFKKGQNKEIRVYTKKEKEEEKKPDPEKKKEKKGAKALKVAGWSFIGLAGASLIVGAVTGCLVISKKNKINDLEKKYAEAPPEEREDIKNEAADHYDQGAKLGNTSTAFFIIAAAAAAGGTALLVLDHKREKKTGGKTDLSLGLSPAGIFVTGTF